MSFLETRRLLLAVLVALLALSACRPAVTLEPTPIKSQAPTPTRTLAPSPTASPRPTRTIGPPTATPTIPPPPTPTPLSYEVKKGDTLLGIALFYGITLEALQAANPDVDPNLISVGTILVIPQWAKKDSTPTVVPTPTPLPVELRQPDCYHTRDTAMWCFALVENHQKVAVENLSGWLSLSDPNGKPVEAAFAVPPLNLLMPEKSIPLAVFFDGPLPDQVVPFVQLVTALPVPDDGRYLPAVVRVRGQEIADSGLEAKVRGTVELVPQTKKPTVTGTPHPSAPSEQSTPTPEQNPLPDRADVIWLAAVAYAADGRVVGVRKWEADQGLAAGEKLPFEMSIFSMGPPIDHVDTLVEARRIFEGDQN